MMARIGPLEMRPYHLLLASLVALGAMVPHTPLRVRLTYFLFMWMWVALAESFNIISGYTGYVCFGYPAFFGTGAMIMGMVAGMLQLSPWLGLLVAALGVLALATFIGIPTLRLRGPYFAICTLAICATMEVVMVHIFPHGIFLPPVYVGVLCYYLMLLLAIGVVTMTYFIAKTKLGIGFVAIREDEDAAETRGLDTYRYKMIALLLSSIPAGLAGAIFGWYSTYVSEEAYALHRIVVIIAMGMLGGAGTVSGPVVGAVLLHTIGYILWARFPFLHMVILGAITMMIVLFAPKGIVGTLREKYPWIRKYLP
jgi:branched-chain amino acid transport system permease protein